MTVHGSLNFVVIDDFLPKPLWTQLLEFAVSPTRTFHPTTVGSLSTGNVKADKRLSWRCDEGLGPYRAAFVDAVHERLGMLFDTLGVPPFPVDYTELELVAHSNGGFFDLHIDTFTQDERANVSGDRMLSAVYYFYRDPKQFSGGDLVFHSLKPGTPVTLLEPKQNRFVAFPAFAPHEVLRVSSSSDDFADSRFSVNCWIHRARSNCPT